ncbi:DASH family cryptochrome [Halomarina rubra]|uniref:Cryptochrome DASH n=1 Tax=Halomarina rubra TaxID=2071873 RepID=A0ABD6B279_9EURY|nr:DASH family cryptochrome [Halomarina rubra]
MTTLVWVRRDLRVHDNPTLASAANDDVVPVYVHDPRTVGEGRYGPQRVGPYRARFLHESLSDYRQTLRSKGADLLVRRGAPEEVVPELVETVGADTVHLQTMPATEEFGVENATREALRGAGVETERFWTHTLYHVEDLASDVEEVADTFTTWRKVTESRQVRNQAPTPETLSLADAAATLDSGDLPTVDEFGPWDEGDADPDDRSVLPFEGGESAGRERVHDYVWEGDHLREYKETRNGLLGADYSSKFSPWLAVGALSPRFLHDEVRRYEDRRVSNESTYWLLFELMWRDFFQFQFVKHGAGFFSATGIRAVEREWPGGDDRFERWAAGETGVPFVDANMRELNETGYLSNRGRQNVASFLVDWLEVDWRRGAAYFEARLVDYDVCSNWGNWAYQAGVGNDSRNMYFNVLKQADDYDADGEYVRRWLPELDGIPGGDVHEPWTLSDERLTECGVELGLDYPRPVVDVGQRHSELRDERL